MNKLTTFYIVRHGQTEWNVRKILQGHTDTTLTKEGKEQALLIHEKLKNVKFDRIFSSDLLRSKRTAEIIALERKMEVQTTNLLRESYFGTFQGSDSKSFFALFDDWSKKNEKERKKHHKYTDLKNVETPESMLTRLLTFLREASVNFSGEKILVVTHGGIIRRILEHLGFLPGKIKSVTNGAQVIVQSDGIEFFLKDVDGVKVIN